MRADALRRPRLLARAAVGAAAAAALTAFAAPEARQDQQVTVRITDQELTVTPAEVRPGRVQLRVLNAARVPYEVEIDGPGVDKDDHDLAPGRDTTVTLELREGRYEIEAESVEGPDRDFERVLTVRRATP